MLLPKLARVAFFMFSLEIVVKTLNKRLFLPAVDIMFLMLLVVRTVSF